MRKFKIKLIKKSNKCFYLVASLNKKSVKAFYLQKLGTIFIHKNNKYVFLSMRLLSKWLNRGAILNSYVSYLAAIIYYKKKNVI